MAPSGAAVVLICSVGEVNIVKLVGRSLTVCTYALSHAQYAPEECCRAEIQSSTLSTSKSTVASATPCSVPNNLSCLEKSTS